MPMTIPRSNHEMAAVVDKGIIISEQFGYGKGCLYMHQHKVPLEVALRVIARPDQRRNYEWPRADYIFAPVLDGFEPRPDAQVAIQSFS